MKAYVYTENSSAPAQTIKISSPKNCNTEQYHARLKTLASRLWDEHGPCIVRDTNLQSIMQVIGGGEYIFD